MNLNKSYSRVLRTILETFNKFKIKTEIKASYQEIIIKDVNEKHIKQKI